MGQENTMQKVSYSIKSKHNAIDNTYTKRIEKYLYSKTNEKKIAKKKLKEIFKNKKFRHLLDIGSGPGELLKSISNQAKQISIIEIIPEYEKTLKKQFPKANIIIDSIDHVELKKKYDFILMSHVLYYFPEKEWTLLCRKLFNALIQDGYLVIIMANDSSDWWMTVKHYWDKLRKYIRFDYIPILKFKNQLSFLGKVTSYNFSATIHFKNKENLVSCITNEVLQISDEAILEKYKYDFIEFASQFEKKKNEYSLNYDNEIIVIKNLNA